MFLHETGFGPADWLFAAAVYRSGLEHEAQGHAKIILRKPFEPAHNIISRCAQRKLARDVPLHTAAHSAGKRVVSTGAVHCIKIRAARQMVHAHKGMEEGFMKIDPWSRHHHVIVKTEGPHVDNLERLVIGADISLTGYPSVYMDCHGTF